MKRRAKQTTYTAEEEHVELRVPLRDADGSACADIVFGYALADPLLVDVSVRSAGGGVVMSRAVLRSDLVRVTAAPDAGVTVPLHARDVVIVPGPGARLRVVLREGHARVEELV